MQNVMIIISDFLILVGKNFERMGEGDWVIEHMGDIEDEIIRQGSHEHNQDGEAEHSLCEVRLFEEGSEGCQAVNGVTHRTNHTGAGKKL